MLRLLRNEPRAALLLLALVMANLLAWGWAWHTFSGSTALMAASLLAWCYGLRHAVDADHIAAIDTVTRKMMQQGKRPSGVGAWFSLGPLQHRGCWLPLPSPLPPRRFRRTWRGSTKPAA